MFLKIKEAAEIAGVSVRTLQYYDKKNLLKPKTVSENGYRLYSAENLSRLQQILFFKELDFGLDEIKKLLDSPGFNRLEALKKQRELLIRKRERLETIISLAEKTIQSETEGVTMSSSELLDAFNMEELENHKIEFEKEAEEKWGKNAAYCESRKRTGSYSKEDWKMIKADSDRIYDKFLSQTGQPADSPASLEAVEDWRNHISKYFYECTTGILKGLGEMYVSDERFKKNIDRRGVGLAEYMSLAIEKYCELKR